MGEYNQPDMSVERTLLLANQQLDTPLSSQFRRGEQVELTADDVADMADRLNQLIVLLPQLFTSRQQLRLVDTAKVIIEEHRDIVADPVGEISFVSAPDVLECLGVEGIIECFIQFPDILDKIQLGLNARKLRLGEIEGVLFKYLTHLLWKYSLIMEYQEIAADNDVCEA